MEAENQSGAKQLFLIEKQKRFSSSQIWETQRRYYAERGIGAWAQGEVPYYVTSNPVFAESYAKIVLAFRRDRLRMNADADKQYICELGAGHGLFTFHFLKSLSSLCEAAQIPVSDFRYVATDLAAQNIAFWRSHPKLQAFFETGLLDCAPFHIGESKTIYTECQGETIGENTLEEPLIVIANYIFDSIPQDQYFFKDGKCLECLISLASDLDPKPEDAMKLMESIHYRYDYRECESRVYAENYLQQILDDYCNSIDRKYIFFPADCLRALHNLQSFSREGLLLLSSDKGDNQIGNIQYSKPPMLVYHKSFSVSVNYHAFAAYAEQQQGEVIFPNRSYASVNTGCFLLLKNPESYTETRGAFKRHFCDHSPDDYYKLYRDISALRSNLTTEAMFSFIRLNRYDAQIFGIFARELVPKISGFRDHERNEMLEILDRVAGNYYEMDETLDLMWLCGCFYYELLVFDKAANCFEASIPVYGRHAGTLSNLAACYYELRQTEKAFSLIREARELEPENKHICSMYADLEIVFQAENKPVTES